MHKIELSKILSDRYADSDEDTNQTRTTPVVVNVDAIRCFTPRRDGRVGSRITFVDGGGFAVIETFDALQAMTDQR